MTWCFDPFLHWPWTASHSPLCHAQSRWLTLYSVLLLSEDSSVLMVVFASLCYASGLCWPFHEMGGGGDDGDFFRAWTYSCFGFIVNSESLKSHFQVGSSSTLTVYLKWRQTFTFLKSFQTIGLERWLGKSSSPSEVQHSHQIVHKHLLLRFHRIQCPLLISPGTVWAHTHTHLFKKVLKWSIKTTVPNPL